ncbi:MAG: cation:proton antiporter [bacterium]
MSARVYAFLILLAVFLITRMYPFGDLPDSQADTVMTLGFVMLAGYLLGEIAVKLSVPRITGYLLTGMFFGPYGTELLPMTSMLDLTLIDKIALTLIALTAGGELHLDALKRNWKSIAAIALLQMLGTFALTGLTLYLFSDLFGFLKGLPLSSIICASILFGTIAMSQSPAITIATITETKASGTTTEVILGISVLLDIFIIIIYSIVLSLVINVETGSGSVGWKHFITLGEEIVFSIALGVVAGLTITCYLKYIRSNPVLFLLAFCYLVSEGSRSIHLDPVLVCVTAGIWVTNASKRGEELIATIESGSLIIYVIFFCVAGALLDLNAVRQMWLGAIFLVLVRTFALFISTTTAIRSTRMVTPSPSTLWLAFLPQAGVSLGLVTLLARSPIEWSKGLTVLMVACIAFNQLIGPSSTKYALHKAGEIKSSQ